ncbi:MAG: MFS transporter [Chloroflexi bacterium]|nr:MFS transporter [Chloroflexota bacterium]
MRPGALAALRYRDFRLLWIGQLISMAGSMMQSAAILWHIYLITKSPLALGMIGLTRLVPILAFALLSGLVADAMDRRRLMLITQGGMTIAALLLAVISFRGVAVAWPIYILAMAGAAFSTFDTPARQSLIPSLVPREHLANAFSLNATMFQFASVLGPSLAGVVIASLGMGWAYLLNALSFLAVVAALLLMRPPAAPQAGRSAISLHAALEGLRFVFQAPIIRANMLLDFFATFFASATALLPIFAQDILRVGAQGYGLLYAAPSLGAILSGLVLAVRGQIKHQGRVLLWAVAGYGMATIIFGLSKSFWITFTALALTGTADMLSMVIRSTVRQLLTPDAMRGRMVSWNMLFFAGGPQLGEVEAGLLARWLGPVISVVVGGLGCLAAAGSVAWWTPELRRFEGHEPGPHEEPPAGRASALHPAR